MKKKIVLAIVMIVVLLTTTLGVGLISSNASIVNPEPECITGTVTMPETNYINGGAFEQDWIWWTSGEQNKYNTEDKIEGNRSLEITPNGSWYGDAGLGADSSSPFTNVPALKDGQLYKFTVCFKITNVDTVGDGLNDLLLCGIYGTTSDALQIRICKDLYGSYGSNWIKVVKYADKDMLPNLNGGYVMISGTKTVSPITVLFDAVSLEIVDESENENTVVPPHDPYTDNYSNAKKATVVVDKNTTYQTMEGMGFYGGIGTLGSGKLYTDVWVEKMVDDLGLSMIRYSLDPETLNEDYPLQQRVDYINALNAQSAKRGYKVRLLLTVWSPPAEFKTNNDVINGGSLKDDCYDDYAQWLVQSLDKYKAAGIDVYGLSLQNEPYFEEPYGSCVYTSQTYAKLLKECVPTIKAKYPNIIIFGAENMLGFEGDPNFGAPQLQAHKVIKNDAEALANIDAFAYHGYSDGVLAEAVDKHKSLWEYSYNQFCKDTGKASWMTETSGYSDEWIIDDNSKPGALGYGIAIGAAIKYGYASAWLHWTGSNFNTEAKDEFCLMDGMIAGKRYAASKHFYRFIRYGDLRVKADSDDDTVFATAFKNDSRGSFSTVIINNSAEDKIIDLQGTGYDTLDYYVTYEDENTNCARFDAKDVKTIRVPKYGMVTVSTYIDDDKILPLPTEEIKPSPKITPVAPTIAPTVIPTVTPTNEAEANVKKVKFVKRKFKIKVGKKVTLKVKLTPKKLTKAAKKVKWSINKKGRKVVKFVKKTKKLRGKLKVKIRTLKKGRAKITCKAPSGKKATCEIVVK